MLSQQRLILDSVIFGLQRPGGISSYWARLLDFAATAPPRCPLQRTLGLRSHAAIRLRDLP